MDWESLERTSNNVNLDHCYAATSVPNTNDTDSAFHLFQVARPTGSPHVWIDILDETNTSIDEYHESNVNLFPISLNSSECASDYPSPPPMTNCCRNSLLAITQQPRRFLTRERSWIPCEERMVMKLYKSLRKYNMESCLSVYRKTEVQCNPRRYALVKRMSRLLRNIFADLSWRVENCFNVHKWCLTHLPSSLLDLYKAAFTDLLHRNKATALLNTLNDLTKDEKLVPCYRVNSITNTKLNFGELSGSSGVPSIRSGCSSLSHRMTAEETVLVCMTFPASRTSKRLNSILHQLSDIGRVSLETAEEQACDSMRIRLRLYVRRVISHLEELRPGSTYLVGFGVGALLMLLAAVHIHSLYQRSERIRSKFTGIICFGMPLVGLRGYRGCPNDPLLCVPQLPTLIVIGSESRLGGRNEALDFRDRLAAHRAQRKTAASDTDRDSVDSTQATEDLNKPMASTFDLLVIGGADHLLRMRSSACKMWNTSQQIVDRRMLGVVKNFICKCNATSRMPHSSEMAVQYEITRSSGVKPSSSITRNLIGPHFVPTPLQLSSLHCLQSGQQHRSPNHHSTPLSTSISDYESPVTPITPSETN